jgi:phosphoribosylamine--glycine ligase
MNILLIGSGGREHALAWAIAKSPLVKEFYCAPGNAGIAQHAECVDIPANDIDRLTAFAKKKDIDFVVIGPEEPLVLGLADRLRDMNILAFGPSAAAARLEGSKAFMKDLCTKYGIPTAAYGRFKTLESAAAFIDKQALPLVVKADGLAAGKGVVICETHKDAKAAAAEMLSGEAFGKSGAEIVVEQYLHGEELSYFALTDGMTMLPLASAQDHKRVFDGDQGPNTGGMGAYSPAHLMTAELEEKILHRIIQPTIKAMAAEGCPFSGVLYAGVMVVKGEPYLLEYNARFGDPECQVLMMRLEADVLDILKACAESRLASVKGKVTWSPNAALCVVMASRGYPGAYEKKTPIAGLDDAGKVLGVTVFHAGTVQGEDGEILSNGGRVLGVTALGGTIAEAQKTAYQAVGHIDWPKGFCRRDIGWRAVKAQKAA